MNTLASRHIGPTSVRIRRQSNATREYDAINVVIADLHLSCDLVNDRQIRLAKALADDHVIPLDVAPELEDRVARALGFGEVAR